MTELLGRTDVLAQVEEFLRLGRDVLLVGPADIGKSALIAALAPAYGDRVTIVDPFAHVSSHLAARILRASDRGTVFLAATRSLDRKYLGAVRRIAWRFNTVRVPPLGGHWMRRLVQMECDRRLSNAAVTDGWTDRVLHLAAGRPGVALAMIAAAEMAATSARPLPSPEVSYVEARIRRAEVTSIRLNPEA